jgi:hypothetical protein
MVVLFQLLASTYPIIHTYIHTYDFSLLYDFTKFFDPCQTQDIRIRCIVPQRSQYNIVSVMTVLSAGHLGFKYRQGQKIFQLFRSSDWLWVLPIHLFNGYLGLYFQA